MHTFIEKHKQRLDYTVLPYILQFQNISSANKLDILGTVDLLGYVRFVNLLATDFFFKF